MLDALQELTRLAVHQKTGRAQPADAGHRALASRVAATSWRRWASKMARRVLESGEREELAPMTPFERKIVHDAVAAVDGVRSESEGAEPSRRVVVSAPD